MSGRFNIEKTFYPSVLFFYYLCIILTVMFTQSVVICSVALVCATVKIALCVGWKKPLRLLSQCALIIIASAAVNGIIGKRGESVLFEIFSHPVTGEALWYGVVTGITFTALFFWFYLFLIQFGSERLRTVFGGLLPRTALFFSMTLRFVSSFMTRFKKSKSAYTLLYGVPRKKLEAEGKIMLSALSLECENAVGVSLSMRSRGYLTGKRKQSGVARFTVRDAMFMLASALLCALGTTAGDEFFPVYKLSFSPLHLSAFFLLCTLTLILELWEEIKWRRLSQKI